MNHGSIPCVHPPATQSMRRRFWIAEVTVHDHVATANITAHFFRCVSQTDQHGWGGTEDGDALLLYQSECCPGIDFAQANVCRANCCDRPHKSPSVRVKHWQSPEIPVSTSHGEMEQRANNVHVGVAMGDHDTLGSGSRAARVVDRQ